MIKAVVTNEMMEKNPPPPEIPPQTSIFSDPAITKLAYYDKQLKWFMSQDIEESLKEKLYQDMLSKARELYNNIRGVNPLRALPPINQPIAATQKIKEEPKVQKKIKEEPKVQKAQDKVSEPLNFLQPSKLNINSEKSESPIPQDAPSDSVPIKRKKTRRKRGRSPVYSGFQF